MGKNPEISVVIPAYNRDPSVREEYISQNIGSVLNQTFQDFEIIVVDDGSDDGTYDIYRGIASRHDNIRVLRHSINQRVNDMKSRFTGLSAARGKYIQFMDSDDVLLPDALRSMHDTAERYGADVVHTVVRVQSIEEGGRLIRPGGKFAILRHDGGAHKDIKEPVLIPYDPVERLRGFIDGMTFGDLQYNLFNRDFLQTNDIDFDGLFLLDWLMKAKTFVKVPFPTYIWRQNPLSQTWQKRSPDYAETVIDALMKVSDRVDRTVERIDFLKSCPGLPEILKMQQASGILAWQIDRHGFYRDGISRELYDVVSKSAHKYTGGGLHGHYHSCSTSPVRGGSSMSRWIISGSSYESLYEWANAA